MDDLRERGEKICRDLIEYGFKAEWVIDPSGELLLYVDNKWLMRCIGSREYAGEILPYWVVVTPTIKSIQEREMGRKLRYVPLYPYDIE